MALAYIQVPYLPMAGLYTITEPIADDRDSIPAGFISDLQHALERRLGYFPTDAENTGQYDQATAEALQQVAGSVYDWHPGIAGLKVYQSLGLITLRVTCLPKLQWFCGTLADQLLGEEPSPPGTGKPDFPDLPVTPPLPGEGTYQPTPSALYRNLLLIGGAAGIVASAWSLLGRRT